ncbi:MAG TPA: response regulator, partial [Bryobacteraceae bacterium]
IRENAVDLLITDVRMPGLSSSSLVQHFQQHSKNAKVVIMSGCDPDTLTAHSSGAKFLPKPFTSKSLLAVVLQTLSDHLR